MVNLTQLQKISVFNRQTINGLCSSIFRSYVKLPKGNGQPTPPKKKWWLDQTQLAKTASAQESSSPSGEPPGKIVAYWRFSEGYILSDFHQHESHQNSSANGLEMVEIRFVAIFLWFRNYY